MCSSGADDLQELPDEAENSDEKPAGQLTPKASDDSPPIDEWEKWEKEEKKNEKSS